MTAPARKKQRWVTDRLTSISRTAKNFVRTVLAGRGLEITRSLPQNGPALPVLRILIERAISDEGKGAIIQVGANDGMIHDPVHDIISSLSLPAILVEPLPDLFDRLVKNYCNERDIWFENAAISEQAGKAIIYRVSAYSSFPDWVQGIASFDKSVLTSHNRLLKKPLDKYIRAVEVPMITMDDLLKKYGRPHVIALQIDREGHDFSVIKSAISAGCLPRIINYESKHLLMGDQVECRRLLVAHGYSFLTNFADTMAYRN